MYSRPENLYPSKGKKHGRSTEEASMIDARDVQESRERHLERS